MLILEIALGVFLGLLLIKNLDITLWLGVWLLIILAGLVVTIAGFAIAVGGGDLIKDWLGHNAETITVVLVLILFFYFINQFLNRKRIQINYLRKEIDSRRRMGYEVNELEEKIKALMPKSVNNIKEIDPNSSLVSKRVLDKERERRKKLGYEK